MRKESRVILFHVLASLFSCCARGTEAQPFSDCSVADYYSSVDINDRSALHNLIESTHRKVLPYTSSNPDVWDALIDLDGRDTNGDGLMDEVLLIYSDIYVAAQDYGTSTTWNREHVWPKSLGVGTGGPDYTDVHHLRPADSNVNAARGNKLFGACGILNAVEDCVSPAHAEAANDTETDNVVWLPPASHRGNVARALFYMDIRYDGANAGELDLILSDCPSDENEMGYLSQLLAWHQEDPVDDAERARNDAVCTSWQGNRNPFVDYPELVSMYFGDPQIPNPPLGYTCNDSSADTTEPPSPSPVNADGTCNGNGLLPGSVMVTAFNSDDPDVLVLLALSDLAPGATFYMTDNAWTGQKFRSNEGTLKFVVPETGISARTIVAYGNASYPFADNWQVESGSFALAASGDTIILYCIESDSSITHLSALSYSGDWVSANLDESNFSAQQSALPVSLPSNAHVAFVHKDNYWYSGPSQGTISFLLDNLSNPSKWEGSNTERFHLSSTDSKFLDSTSAATTRWRVGIAPLVITAMTLFFI